MIDAPWAIKVPCPIRIFPPCVSPWSLIGVVISFISMVLIYDQGILRDKNVPLQVKMILDVDLGTPVNNTVIVDHDYRFTLLLRANAQSQGCIFFQAHIVA